MRKRKADNLIKKIAGALVGALVRRSANLAIALRALLIGTSVLCIAIITILILIRSMPGTHAPDIVGQPLISGILLLQERELVPFVKIEYSDSTSQVPGTVLKQRPSAGSYLRTGQTVELIVHSGAESIIMPNLIGTAFDDVQNAVLFLDSTGSIQYRIDTVTYDHSDLPVGTITLQTPQAGDTVGYFTKIHVVVSLGPQTTNNIQIPNLIGVHYELALSQIIASQLQHSIVVGSTANDGTTANDLTIITQSPLGGINSGEQAVEFGLKPPSQLPVNQYFDIYTSDLSAYALESNIEIVHIDFMPDTENKNNDPDEQPLPQSEQLLLQFKLFQDIVYLPYLLPIGSTLEIRVDGNIVETLQIGN